MLNLSTLLESSARKYPEKAAYVFMDTSLSFKQVNDLANRVANGLIQKGIKPGDKVALSCLNLPYFPAIYFGILKTGAAVVPLSVLLKTDEIKYHLQDSDAKAYFCFVGTAELPMAQMGHEAFKNVASCEHFFVITPQPTDPSPIENTTTFGQLVGTQAAVFDTFQASPDDTAIIVYTSGTTGKPKGAELTHSNLLLNAMVLSDLIRIENSDTLLIVLPLFHIFAMSAMMNAGLYKGASAVLVPRFEAASVLQQMDKNKVTIFAGVPTMYWGLVNYKEDNALIERVAKNLKLCASGGASLPVKVLEDFEKIYKVPILEGYGMSEGSPVVSFNQIDVGRKPGSVGTPVWGVEVKLVDTDGNEVATNEPGELCYKGHNVMKGYYKKPQETAETLKNGWLHSGDIAKRDEDGFYFIIDRTKDMIIRGGLNVYPREVEELIIQHPAVSLVAVIGVPDEQFGEEIKACVVLKENQNVTDEELINWTKERIASYKYPRKVAFMPSLPMSATGKILKRELR